MSPRMRMSRQGLDPHPSFDEMQPMKKTSIKRVFVFFNEFLGGLVLGRVGTGLGPTQ